MILRDRETTAYIRESIQITKKHNFYSRNIQIPVYVANTHK